MYTKFKGQQITSATLIDSIWLADFMIIFQTLFQLYQLFFEWKMLQNVLFYNSYFSTNPGFIWLPCEIAALEWYAPDSKSTKKWQKFIKLHSEHVSNKAIFKFDFKEEMQWYCNISYWCNGPSCMCGSVSMQCSNI